MISPKYPHGVHRCIGITLWLAAFLPGLALADPRPYTIDPATVFAVITHRGGIAAALAHEHLITADDYRAQLVVDPNDLNRSAFDLEVPVDRLAVDRPELATAVLPDLRAYGVVDTRFPELSAAQIEGLRLNMFSPAQLDARRFPTLGARLLRLTPLPEVTNRNTHSADVALSVRGITITQRIPARVSLTGEVLNIEALARYKFTDFGIQPFAAAGGLIRVADEFHVYVTLSARAAATPTPAEN